MRPGIPPGWDQYSRTERNAAYDNMAAVADAAALAKRREIRSASFRANNSRYINQRYGPGSRNQVDVYPGKPDAPCLIFIHGGYWIKNDREGFACMAQGLAKYGWSAALVGYPLAPEASLSDIVKEIGLALDWIGANRLSYGISGPNLLAGWSAGATLALIHADHSAVDMVLAISGIYDLEPLLGTDMNLILALSDEEVRTYSPLRRSPPRVPVVLAVGDKELPAIRDNTEHMARYLSPDGDVTPVRIADADHFTILDELTNPAGRLTSVALKLFEPM